MIRKYDPHKTMHAEMSAVFKALKREDIGGSTIVVYRETKDGQMAMSRPCSVCMKILKSVGVKSAIYTSTDGIVQEFLE